MNGNVNVEFIIMKMDIPQGPTLSPRFVESTADGLVDIDVAGHS